LALEMGRSQRLLRR